MPEPLAGRSQGFPPSAGSGAGRVGAPVTVAGGVVGLGVSAQPRTVTLRPEQIGWLAGAEPGVLRGQTSLSANRGISLRGRRAKVNGERKRLTLDPFALATLPFALVEETAQSPQLNAVHVLSAGACLCRLEDHRAGL